MEEKDRILPEESSAQEIPMDPIPAEETIAEEKPVEKKPKLKIEVGKRYMLKPYSDLTDARMLNEKIWRRDFSQPVEVISDNGVDEQGFYVECANKNKWFVDSSSFLCECIDIEKE